MSLKIGVRFFALYRELVGKERVEMEVSEGTTPAQIWDDFRQKFPRLMDQSAIRKVAVNGEYADPDCELREGDEVAFIPPLSGG